MKLKNFESVNVKANFDLTSTEKNQFDLLGEFEKKKPDALIKSCVVYVLENHKEFKKFMKENNSDNKKVLKENNSDN